MRVARTYRIPEETDAKIKKLAAQTGTSEADVIALAIRNLKASSAARVKAEEAGAFPLIEVKSRHHAPKIPANYGVPPVRAPIPRPNGKL